MTTTLIETLRKLELSEYESRVYLALIELGETTSGTILTKAHINSGKIYLILESLSQKGLVTEITKNNVRHFRAVDPRSIEKYLDQKQKEFDAKRTLYESILPRLLAAYSSSASSPEIRVYTGFEGMKSAYDQELLRYASNKELLVFGVLDYAKHHQAAVRYFTSTLFPAREQRKVNVKKIVSTSARNNAVEKRAQIRYIEYDSFFTYNIIDDLVIFAIWSSEPICITILSKEVSNGLRKNFDTIWKQAKA